MGPQPLGPQDPPAVGPFELLARLGSGGMGRVYLAQAPDDGRPVAVKVVDADYARGRDYLPRFRAEVTAARTVRSPYVAALVDADPEGPTPWLATEYVRGGSLRDLVHECGALPELTVRQLGAGLAEALTAIHEAGLAHRDLTPANVLLTPDGPRVIDFGIARAAGAPALTRTGAVLGTPGYMAPEQAAGFRAGPAGDLYALGAVLVYAVTGSGPHLVPGPLGASTVLPGVLARLGGRGPDLRAVPATLRPLLRELMAHDPMDRPIARLLRARLLAGDASGQSGSDLDFEPDWLPEPVRAALARDSAAAEGYLRPPDPRPLDTGDTGGTGGTGGSGRTSATAGLGRALIRLGGALSKETGPGLSRRAVLLTGATVAAAAGGLGWAAARRQPPAPPSKPPFLDPLWQVSSAPPLLQFAPAPAYHLVLYTDETRLIALDRRSGQQVWAYSTDSLMTDPVVSGQLAFALSGGSVLCVSVPDGALNSAIGPLLSEELGTIMPSTLLAADDYTVYGGGPVQAPVVGLPVSFAWFALPPATERTRWAFTDPIAPTGLIYDTTSAFRGLTPRNQLIFADDTGHLVARATANGRKLWAYPARGYIWQPGTTSVTRSSWATLAPDGSRLYLPVGQDESMLQSLGAADSSELHHDYLPHGAQGPWTPAAVYQDLVLTACGEPLLRAYDAADLRLRWTCPLPAPPAPARPMVVRDSLFVPGALGHLYRVDLRRQRVDGIFAPDSRFGAEWRLATDGTLLYAGFGLALYALTAP
ncbi:protein kinase domain-containing protein [Kitasatospora azatica]|uniref:serine/threonine-protein kinase n=1 Tax=Kitasatospora azatica TaxID=58347 RepID=UPI00068C5460|nr:serine/threonine-protein kinase [Kitasatospora azatica]